MFDYSNLVKKPANDRIFLILKPEHPVYETLGQKIQGQGC